MCTDHRHNGSIAVDPGQLKTSNSDNIPANNRVNSKQTNANSTPPTPLAYGSFSAPDKKAAIETLSNSNIVKNYLDKKPTATKKGMISNKPRGQPNQSNKGVAPDEKSDKETISSEVKTKPHTEGKIDISMHAPISFIQLTY